MFSKRIVVTGPGPAPRALAGTLRHVTRSEILYAPSLVARDLCVHPALLRALGGGAVVIWWVRRSTPDLWLQFIRARESNDWWGAAVFLGPSGCRDFVLTPSADLGLRVGPGSPCNFLPGHVHLPQLLESVAQASAGAGFQWEAEWFACLNGAPHRKLESHLGDWVRNGSGGALEAALAILPVVDPFLFREGHRILHLVRELHECKRPHVEIARDLADAILDRSER